MPKNQKISAIADPDTRNSGILDDSETNAQGGSREASAAELAMALAAMQRRNAELESQLAAKSESDSISRLAEILAPLVQKPAVQAVPEADNMNRVSDFKNQRATIDGQAMMESQYALSGFKSEDKMPITIPKSMANAVGSSLAITVNGVRVCIPCDGKTHYINRTHWEHARERLAKIDVLLTSKDPQIVEIS